MVYVWGGLGQGGRLMHATEQGSTGGVMECEGGC